MDQEIALKLRASIAKHEGLSLDLYQDAKGYWTIGYGHNLTLNKISKTIADILLNDDIAIATMELYRFLPLAQGLDDVRKAVLIELCFNIGIEHVLQFRAMIDALKEKDYVKAAAEIRDSQWAREVGNRAHDLAYSMESGIL